MDMNDEFDPAINGAKENTYKQYRSVYNRLMKSQLFERNITTTGEDKIISNIKLMTDNPNTRQSLLNVCIVIKKYFNKPCDGLVKYRDDLKKDIEMHHKKKDEKLNDELPDYSVLSSWMEGLYDANEYHKYVLNYLLLNYFCRNEDLDCIVTYDKKRLENTEFNYLYLQKTRVTFVRNKYKTVRTYGQKVDKVLNKHFIKSIYALDLKEGEYLLKNENGEHIAQNSMGWYVQNNTYSRLGEGNYFKIAVKKYRDNPKKLQEMGNHRGTDINTVLDKYFVIPNN